MCPFPSCADSELPVGRTGANPALWAAGANQAITPVCVINSYSVSALPLGRAAALGTAPGAGSRQVQTCLRQVLLSKTFLQQKKKSRVADSYRIILLAVSFARNRWKCR